MKIPSRILASILGAAILLSLAGCGGKPAEPKEQEGLQGREEDAASRQEEEAPNTDREIPDRIGDLSPRAVAFAFTEALAGQESYLAEMQGVTEAKVLFLNYRQQISGDTMKSGDEVYFTSLSSSALLKTHHEAYRSGDRVAYRDDDSSAPTVTDLRGYDEIYGFTPTEPQLCGFLVTEESLLSAQFLREERADEGDPRLLVYSFTLDGNAGGEALKRQMVKFGGLTETPVFSSVQIEVTMRQDLSPVSTSVRVEYETEMPLLGRIACTQSLRTDYRSVGEPVSLPSDPVWKA